MSDVWPLAILLGCGLVFNPACSGKNVIPEGRPSGVLCLLSPLSERGPGGYCASTESPDNQKYVPVNEMDGYICRPGEFEKQIVEFIKSCKIQN